MVFDLGSRGSGLVHRLRKCLEGRFHDVVHIVPVRSIEVQGESAIGGDRLKKFLNQFDIEFTQFGLGQIDIEYKVRAAQVHDAIHQRFV